MRRPGEFTALAFCVAWVAVVGGLRWMQAPVSLTWGVREAVLRVAGLAALAACFVFVEALWRCRPWLPRAAAGWAATVVGLQAAWVFAPHRAASAHVSAAAAMLSLSAVGMAAYVRWTAAALPQVQAP